LTIPHLSSMILSEVDYKCPKRG